MNHMSHRKKIHSLESSGHNFDCCNFVGENSCSWMFEERNRIAENSFVGEQSRTVANMIVGLGAASRTAAEVVHMTAVLEVVPER